MDEIIPFIVCPHCKKNNFKKNKNKLVCLNCDSTYPIKDDILVLVSPKKQPEILKIWNEKYEYEDYGFAVTKKVAEEIKKRMSSKTVSLDVGCGGGAYERIAQGKIIAFDVIPFFVKKAKNANKGKDKYFLVADATEMPFRESSFDLVFCSQVIEHFKPKESENLIKQMINCSKRYVIIDTPNDGNSFIRFLRGIIYPEGPDHHHDERLDHHRLFSAKDFEKYNFDTHSCIGFISRQRFNFGSLWEIYDFVAWRVPGFGGNLVSILDKQK